MVTTESKSLNGELCDKEACKEGEEVNAEEDGIQMGKVIDASLYGTDIMTDGIQFVHHRLNCHWRWAIGTAAFMLMPAVVEAIALAIKWFTWMRKACLVRLTVSCFKGCLKINFCGFVTGKYNISDNSCIFFNPR